MGDSQVKGLEREDSAAITSPYSGDIPETNSTGPAQAPAGPRGWVLPGKTEARLCLWGNTSANLAALSSLFTRHLEEPLEQRPGSWRELCSDALSGVRSVTPLGCGDVRGNVSPEEKAPCTGLTAPHSAYCRARPLARGSPRLCLSTKSWGKAVFSRLSPASRGKQVPTAAQG